ncbi:MAG: hypothetical protein ABMA64_42450 [Myxococcota bacterium]
MFLLLLQCLSPASADPIDDLAPGPRELSAVQDELLLRLDTAEAIERAVARLQSAYLVTIATDELCRDPLRGPLVVRLRLFAEAWHAAAQRSRVQAKRVEWTSTSPTVTPVIDTDRRAALDKLMARARAQDSAWLEFVAWAEQASIEVCDLELIRMPGLPDPIVRGEGEKIGGIAVTTVGDGYVCPSGVKAPEGTVLILNGPACWSADAACGCTAEPLEPGSVLGP